MNDSNNAGENEITAEILKQRLQILHIRLWNFITNIWNEKYTIKLEESTYNPHKQKRDKRNR